MCFFAGDVLNGRCAPPYDEQSARAYARAFLVPEELLEHPHDFDVAATAHWLGMPVQELELELVRAKHT